MNTNNIFPVSVQHEPCGTERTSPAITIITPIYNVEKYMREGLDCLVNQSFRDLEIIIVDDCGTDGSMDIAREYAQRDPRISILHNEKNSGPGAARNRGIEAAKGKYIAFFDIDDSCDNNFYEVLYQLAEKNDALIVKGGCYVVDMARGKTVVGSLNNFIRRSLEEGFDLYASFTHEHWSALFRRDWVMETGARNGSDLQGEDVYFLIHVCQGANKRFILTDEVRYHYRQWATSASHIHDVAYFRSQLESKHERLDCLNAMNLGGKSYARYCATLLDYLSHLFIKDLMLCEEGTDFCMEYLQEVTRFASKIKNHELLKAYTNWHGSDAILRMLQINHNSHIPWIKRYIYAWIALGRTNKTPAASPKPKEPSLEECKKKVPGYKRLIVKILLKCLGLNKADSRKLRHQIIRFLAMQ